MSLSCYIFAYLVKHLSGVFGLSTSEQDSGNYTVNWLSGQVKFIYGACFKMSVRVLTIRAAQSKKQYLVQTAHGKMESNHLLSTKNNAKLKSQGN